MNFLMRQLLAPAVVTADTVEDKIQNAISDIENKYDSEVYLRFSNTKSSKPKDLVKYGPIGALSLSLPYLRDNELPPLVKKSFKYIQVINAKPKKIVDLSKLNTEGKVIRLLVKIFEKQDANLDEDSYAAQKNIYRKKNIGPFGKGFINHPQHLFMTFIRYDKKGNLRDPLDQAQLLLTAGYDAIYDQEFGALVKNQDCGYLFLRPQAFQFIDTVDLGAVAKPKAAVKNVELDAESQEVLLRYTPDLSAANVEFQKLKTWEQVSAALPKMSPDDIAWQISHGKFAQKVDGHPVSKENIGLRESCFLILQNPNIEKKEKSDLAQWMIEKAGLNFVGGASLNQFIKALAKRGDLNDHFLNATDEDDNVKQIFYGQIKDPAELRKFDIDKYGYQLARNPHTPGDVLVEIGKKKGEFSLTGTSLNYGGVIGKDATVNFADALQHDNYPIKDLVKAYKAARKKYPQPNAMKSLARVMLERPDCPEDIREDAFEQGGGMLWDGVSEKWLGGKRDKYDRSQPFIPDQKAFDAYWKILLKEDAADKKAWKAEKDFDPSTYATSLEYDLYEWVENPFMTDSILHEIADWDLRNDDKGQPMDAIVRAKIAAVKKLRERGHLSDKDAAETVRKKLKFEGPDELLAHFTSHSYIGKGENKLKFTKVSDAELDQLSSDMQKDSAHDDFTFQVVGAYRFDKPLHKDYEKVAERIQNVKKGLYHGTSCDNAAGILSTGVNVSAKERTGSMFGNGFYLASASSKAVQYASDNFSKEGFGVVFKLNAALGKTADWKYGRPEYDEVQRKFYYFSDEKKAKVAEYRKKHNLKSDDFNTGWHMDHDSVTARKGMALLHDEYVVKSGDQLQIELVILVKKTKAE